jgi:hypothetical protein
VQILLEDGTPYEHAGKLAFSDVTVDPIPAATSCVSSCPTLATF